MTIQHSNALKNSLCDHAVDAIDVGTTNGAGRLIFQTAGSAAVATIPFNNPAFGAAGAGALDDGVAEMDNDPMPEDDDAAGGTITKFVVQNCDETPLWEGTANTTTGDIVLTSAAIGAGETVRLEELFYEVP